MITIDNSKWKAGDFLDLVALVKLELDAALLRDQDNLVERWLRIYEALDASVEG